MTYDEGLSIRQKWADGAMAELLGFKAAMYSGGPRLFSTSEYMQQRYEQGFVDGTAMKMADRTAEEMAHGLQP